MKKILFALCLLIAFQAQAQNKKKPSPKAKYTPEKVAAMQDRQGGYENAQNRGNAVQLKKDGTPDRRYKENQGNGVGPKKKDGSPDMRYNSNKSQKKN